MIIANPNGFTRNHLKFGIENWDSFVRFEGVSLTIGHPKRQQIIF